MVGLWGFSDRYRRVSIGVTSFAVTALMVFMVVAVQTRADWVEPTRLVEEELKYFDSDIAILRGNDIYAVSWSYDSGSILLFKSGDAGESWSVRDVFGYGIFRGEPGMCAYSAGSSDEVLISTCGALYKSTDGGDSFSHLSDLPLSSGALWWRFMEIGTNASWSKGPVDSDIYMVGSQAVGIPWEDGTYAISFTKSCDGGLSWSEPVLVTSLDRMTKLPEMICDGERLFVFYTSGETPCEYSDLYVRSSDDWGATWSEEKVLIPSRGSQWVSAHSVQHLNGDRALITVADLVLVGEQQMGLERMGRYGYFNYADSTFQEVGNVSGDEWKVGGAFSGAIANSGELHLIWMKTTSAPFGNLWYTSSKDSGLSVH